MFVLALAVGMNQLMFLLYSRLQSVVDRTDCKMEVIHYNIGCWNLLKGKGF